MEYVITIISLFVIAIGVFKIADKYNIIIDKPNHRSAHTENYPSRRIIIFPLHFIILGSQIIQQNQ